MKKKTHEQYVAEVAGINPNIEVVEKYNGANNKILHRCKVDGYEWNPTPHNVLKGEGCPVCGGTLQKTHDQYILELEKTGKPIKVIGRYINARTKILHECLIDGYEWMATPDSVLHKTGCPKCAGNIKRTQEEYEFQLSQVNNNICVVGKYINKDIAIEHMCQIDGYIWNAIPNNVLGGEGCPMCANHVRRTHEMYVNDVKKRHPNIDVIGIFVDTQSRVLHRCKEDGCEWYAIPNNVLRGSGCPMCNQSRGEKCIATYLNCNHIQFVTQKVFSECKNVKPLPFDFYLPKYNVCIEFDGIQHFEPVDYFGGKDKFQQLQYNDSIKTNYCLSNNIILLRIRYDQDVNTELDNFFNNTKLIKEVS